MQSLEPFRGGDDQVVTSWLTYLEELFDTAQQNPEERLQIVSLYLAGDAKQWYRMHRPYNFWCDFKTALVNAFTSSARQLKTPTQLYKYHLLHSQHVLDDIAHQKRQNELMRSSHNVSFSFVLVESTNANLKIEWPTGEETWFIHDELPQRSQFVTSVDHGVVPLLVEQSNKIILLSQQSLAEEDAILKQNQLLKTDVAKEDAIINGLVLIVGGIKRVRMLHEVKLSHELHFTQFDPLIKYPLFSESYSQCGSTRINDGYYECSRTNVKYFSLRSIKISSGDSFNSCIVQLVSIKIILLTFLFVGVVFVSNLVFHGINNFDWFRTLAVP